MSQQEFSKEDIRRAVREALREAIPVSNRSSRQSSTVNSPLMKQILASVKDNCKYPVVVDLSSDRKVNQFAVDLAKCLQDSNVAGLIRSGKMKFQTSAPNKSNQPTVRTSHSSSNTERRQANEMKTNGRIESGVLTESKILTLAKNHQKIEVGRGVILTPLAKDRARRLKIEIVRQ